MSTALAAARAKTQGKRMLRDALDAYGDEDTSLAKWNARKTLAAADGKWLWKQRQAQATAAIKAKLDREAVPSRVVDIDAEMSSTVHQDQHGGQLLGPGDNREDQCSWRERIGGTMHYCTNLLPLTKKKKDSTSQEAPSKRRCLWHAVECAYSGHPMGRSRVIEVPNEFGMCLHCYEETASTRQTLQKVPPRLGVKKIPGVCATDIRKEVKREAMVKHPGARVSVGGGRNIGPNSVCEWQKEHSEVAYVWRCTNRVLMHPVLRGSYLPFCGFHASRCIQEYGNKGKKAQPCPGIDRRNTFGLCRNHLEAHLSTFNYEERGGVLLFDSDFDVPGVKECKKEEVIASVARHPLAPKYPPPPQKSQQEPIVSMETTSAVIVLPARLPRTQLQKLVKKTRIAIENLVQQALDHPNPVSVIVKEALWRLQFHRRAALVTTRIQRIYRGNRARRRVRLLLYEQAALDRIRACRVLQRFVRGFLGRRRFAHEHENVHQAVPHIQRLIRGALARKRFWELCAAIRVQRNYRRYRQRLLMRAFREEIAYMQRLQRQADTNYSEMEKQLETFRRLRARRVLRAHMTRWKERQELREQEVAERLRSLLGTVKIQRQWRRHRRYTQIKERYDSTQLIQKHVRGWLTRRMWLGDPGVEFTVSFINSRSGFEYGKAVIQNQPSKSYSFPSRKIRTHFGALTIQRALRGHFGRLKANARWVNMLKRWEWLGISCLDSSGGLSDSMTVGRQRYGFYLPSFAYHRDRKHHMRPIANDPLPDRGHAYKYQYILDLIKDRDGRRGWSLAKEEMHARQLKEEQAWLAAEEARRAKTEAEIAAKELRKHIFKPSDALAKAMPLCKSIFPVGSLVEVAPKIRSRGVQRRAKILNIHNDVGPNGEPSASFDIEYLKVLRNSYGRLEENGEQRVQVERLRPIPITSGSPDVKNNAGALIEAAINSLRADIHSKATTVHPEDGQYRVMDALSTVDALVDRLRDCREGFDLLYDQRDFVDFVFRNSTLLRLEWLQVVSHIRYGTYSQSKQQAIAEDNEASTKSMMEGFYRDFGIRNNQAKQAMIPMPERAQIIERRMTQLGFHHDPSAGGHKNGVLSDKDAASDAAIRPETTPGLDNDSNRPDTSSVVDDMMLFRGEQPPRTSQDLHRLIYELKTLPREAHQDRIIHVSSRCTHAYVCGHPACGRCFSSRKAARSHQSTAHEGRERLASATPLVDQYLHSYWPPDTPWENQKPQRMVGVFSCSRAGCETLQFRTRRELNRHRVHEHGIAGNDTDAEGLISSSARSPSSFILNKTTTTTGVIWLGPFVVCHHLETKLGLPATVLSGSRKCPVHNKPDQLCTACFLEHQRPVSPYRLYSAVAIRKAGCSNSSIRIESGDQHEGPTAQAEHEQYMIFRDDDDEFCPAVNIWGVYSVSPDAPKRRAKDQLVLPDALSTVLYMQVSLICRDAVGQAWLFGYVMAHQKRSKAPYTTGDEREVVREDSRGLSFALLDQIVGAASIHYCSQSLFLRKYCSQDNCKPGSLGILSALGPAKKLFCRPHAPVDE